MRSILPVLTVIAAILALWYLACVPMNIKETLTGLERAGAVVTPGTAIERRGANPWGLVAHNRFAISQTWLEERPRLPAPHQVVTELWDTTVGKTFC